MQRCGPQAAGSAHSDGLAATSESPGENHTPVSAQRGGRSPRRRHAGAMRGRTMRSMPMRSSRHAARLQSGPKLRRVKGPWRIDGTMPGQNATLAQGTPRASAAARSGCARTWPTSTSERAARVAAAASIPASPGRRKRSISAASWRGPRRRVIAADAADTIAPLSHMITSTPSARPAAP